MTATAPSTTQQAPATPRRRRIAAWAAIAAGLIAVGAVGATLAELGRWDERSMLDPESAGPTGSRALVEILRDQGITVTIVKDHEAASQALDATASTLVLLDAPALSDEGLRAVTDRATDVVLVDPRSRSLDLLVPGSTAAGFGPGDAAVTPDCALPDANRAGAIIPGAVYTAGEGDACYPAGDGWAVVGAAHGAGRAVAVDGRTLFTNEHLAEDGNAALAMNLIGRQSTVVWYAPGPDDTDIVDANPALGELTPPWVSPVIVLLLVAGVAAAIWRGRRFGPLVAERLPVTVRASETTEGRARLYAQSRDTVHAADQLRIGALTRIAVVLRLGASAPAREVADAAASVTAIDRATVHRVLLDDLPASDADLIALSEHVRHLEDAVHAAVRPERNP